MDFDLTDSQRAVRDTTREYLGARHPVHRLAAGPGHIGEPDPDGAGRTWRQLTDLGWLDADLGPVEQVLIAEQTGAFLLSAPWLTTVALAAPAYAAGGRELTGPATLAWLDAGACDLRAAAATPSCVLERDTGGWRLTGVKHAVPDAVNADTAVVAARTPDGAALALVDLRADREQSDATALPGDGPATRAGRRDTATTGPRPPTPGAAARAGTGPRAGHRDPAAAGTGDAELRGDGPATDDGVVHPVSGLDPTRPVAELRFAGTPAEPLVPAAECAAVLTEVRHRALTLLAGEAVGVAQRALDIAVEHAGRRTQFGRPVGAFQAVAHRLADVYRDLTLARSLAYRAAGCLAAASSTTAEAVLTARVAAGRCAVAACEAAIQTLGAVGFSWEHPLHRFYRRAQVTSRFDGTAAELRAQLATLLFAADNEYVGSGVLTG